MIKSQLVSLGARVPSDLKKKVSEYCDRNGVKLQFFVAEALQEKLIELMDDQIDGQLAKERLNDAKVQVISSKSMRKKLGV